MVDFEESSPPLDAHTFKKVRAMQEVVRINGKIADNNKFTDSTPYEPGGDKLLNMVNQLWRLMKRTHGKNAQDASDN